MVMAGGGPMQWAWAWSWSFSSLLTHCRVPTARVTGLIVGLMHALFMSDGIVTLLHCLRLSQYDCRLPFPCIHAQTMQHCQQPHTASNFSNFTWAGQKSATLCLWCSRMKTTNGSIHDRERYFNVMPHNILACLLLTRPALLA
jgi:hypothetical protein